MAKRTAENALYYINPSSLTFVEDSGYGANFIQVSASSSCYILVYSREDRITADEDNGIRKWKVTAYNNKFPDNGPWNIYVRLERSGSSALIVYDKRNRLLNGAIVTQDEDGNEVVGEPDGSYYYVKIGTVSETDGTSIRQIEYDTGYLGTDEANMEIANLLKDMFIPHYDDPQDPSKLTWIEAKANMGVAGGVTSFIDNGKFDLPSIYDGLRIDNQTLKWKEFVAEDGSKVKVLVAEGGGTGTLKNVSVTGTGNAITSVKLEDEGSKIVFGKEKVFAEKGYLDTGFLPLTGGTLTGDLRIGESFGNALRFGDGDFCMIEEDTDDHMRIYAGTGLDVRTQTYFGVSGQGIKLNGGVLKYNSTEGYWELDGDLLVNGGIASYSSSTAYKPSTVMDGVVTDEKTIRKNEYGQLEAIQKTEDSGVKVKIVSKGDAMDEQNVLYVIV